MRRKLGITVMAVMLFLLASFPVFSNPASEVRLGVLKGPTGIHYFTRTKNNYFGELTP